MIIYVAFLVYSMIVFIIKLSKWANCVKRIWLKRNLNYHKYLNIRYKQQLKFYLIKDSCCSLFVK